MLKLSKEDQKLLDSVYSYAPTGQLIVFCFWDIFAPKKRNKVMEYLRMGTSWRFAYETAKKL